MKKYGKSLGRKYRGLLLVALAAAGCAGAQGKSRCECGTIAVEDLQDQGPGAALWQRFEDAVGEYDVTQPSASDDVMGFLLAQTKEILEPHKNVLHQQALWELKKIPKVDRISTEGWASPMGANSEQQIGEMIAAAEARLDEIATAYPLMLVAWNPAHLFGAVKSIAYSRFYPVRVFATQSTLESIVRPKLVRLNDDGKNPVLAIQGKREYFAIAFRFDAARGYYLPARVEWLMREVRAMTGESSPSDLPLSQEPGQSDVADGEHDDRDPDGEFGEPPVEAIVEPQDGSY